MKGNIEVVRLVSPRSCFLTCGLRSQAPGEEVADVERDADEIGGDKSKLRGANADNANDRAIDGGDDPGRAHASCANDRISAEREIAIPRPVLSSRFGGCVFRRPATPCLDRDYSAVE